LLDELTPISLPKKLTQTELDQVIIDIEAATNLEQETPPETTKKGKK
jgi:hypothetical protein